MVRRFALLDLGLVLVYIAMIASIVFGLVTERRRTLAQYASEEGAGLQQKWDKWRNDVAAGETDKGLVKRRVPKSTEPPTVVLMREHFTVCLTAGIVLSSVLYAFFAFVIRGMVSTPAVVPDRARGESHDHRLQ